MKLGKPVYTLRNLTWVHTGYHPPYSGICCPKEGRNGYTSGSLQKSVTGNIRNTPDGKHLGAKVEKPH